MCTYMYVTAVSNVDAMDFPLFECTVVNDGVLINYEYAEVIPGEKMAQLLLNNLFCNKNYGRNLGCQLQPWKF